MGKVNSCTQCYACQLVVQEERFLLFLQNSLVCQSRRKADEELCSAIQQVILGRANDLGCGVYKKRLRRNQHRSIILARTGQYLVYEYSFAKQDRDNIDDDELAGFRRLVNAYSGLTAQQVSRLVDKKD